MEQRAKRFDVWREPMVELRAPKIFHLRRDPFERADTDANTYNEWWEEHAPYIYMAQARVAQAVKTLKEFPPRQKPASFNMDKILENMERANKGS
jgi:arylsulfatase